MKYLSNFRPLFPARLRDFPPAFDELFHQFNNALQSDPNQWTPKVNISETSQAYMVKVEVPGINPEDVDVTVTADGITLSGEKREERKEEDENSYYSEHTYGSFNRHLNFPTAVAADSAEAMAENGILTIKVPKAKAAQTHKLKVSSK